jgi:CDGSH-type Zn-finger protein
MPAVSRDETTVRAYEDGPLLVRGPVRLLDGEGNEIPVRRRTIALCRCGRSRTQPLCDGAHTAVNFRCAASPMLERLSLGDPDDGDAAS